MDVDLFAWLLKYPWSDFSRGALTLGAPWSWALAAVPLAIALVVLAHRTLAHPKDRVVLATLRSAAIALVVLCLCQPLLVLSVDVPAPGAVGVLLDNSQSLTLGSGEGARQLRSLVAESGDLARALGDREVRWFRFDRTLAPVERGPEGSIIANLTFDGPLSALGQALSQAVANPEAPTSWVVVSDGATAGGDDDALLRRAIQALQVAGIPVHTVAVGPRARDLDVEIQGVQLPTTALAGGAVTARVTVAQRGFDGRQLTVVAEDDERRLAAVPLTLAGAQQTATLQLPVDDAGPLTLRFRIPPQPGETLVANNVRQRVVDVQGGPRRILYLEGEPRFEFKFLRRAVDDDDALQVVGLVRTAESRFYRVGIDDPEELANGFPGDAKTLFAYHGLILGSVEAGFFNGEQHRLLHDFVDRRGGGLLTLGGRRALGEGGFAATPLATALPVVLPPGRRGEFTRQVPVTLGIHAADHPTLQGLMALDTLDALPTLTMVNGPATPKPGAQVLLQGPPAIDGTPLPLLSLQRYGRGHAMTFAVADSWRWQMHAQVPVDDVSHETLWRGLLRTLVADAPGPVTLAVPPDPAVPGETLTVTATVRDESHHPVPDAQVVLVGQGPGRAFQVSLIHQTNGRYTATIAPSEAGLWTVEVRAERGDVPLGEATGYLLTARDAKEPFGSQRNTPLLRDIARATGGQFFPAGEAVALATHLDPPRDDVQRLERRALWDAPLLLGLILVLLAAEWLYRRARGLV